MVQFIVRLTTEPSENTPNGNRNDYVKENWNITVLQKIPGRMAV